MRGLFGIFAAIALIVSCNARPKLVNVTRPGGYAMGERVLLKFSLTVSNDAPDSIETFVLEKKTGYTYTLKSGLENCESVCEYFYIWDGRKPDGSWPTGGTYLVYAVADLDPPVYSDTIQIGLAD